MSDKNFLKVPPINHFVEVVQAYERDHSDEIYSNSINQMKQTNLKSLNQKDVELILKPFFLKWGVMGRVLGFEGCAKIGTVLKDMNEDLFDVRFCSLADDFKKISNVPEFYNKIRNSEFKSPWNNTKQVCSTATSKALHLIAPDFFVMWDVPIRGFYGFKDEGEEYQRFLANMKHWIEHLNPTVTALSEEFGKTKTKIIDEFNWYRFRCWW